MAPTATGSSATGFPSSRAVLIAFSIASIECGLGVPMLMLSAFDTATSSSVSSTESDMMGDAPKARRALAVKSCTTEFVMLWTSGLVERIFCRSAQME